MIRRFLEEYTERNSEALDASPAILTHTSIFSPKLADVAHDYISTLVEETKAFCKDQGYNIDRISFFSVYDTDLDLMTAYSTVHSKVSLNNDLILKIVEKKNGKLEAIIFSGSWLEVSYINNESES